MWLTANSMAFSPRRLRLQPGTAENTFAAAGGKTHSLGEPSLKDPLSSVHPVSARQHASYFQLNASLLGSLGPCSSRCFALQFSVHLDPKAAGLTICSAGQERVSWTHDMHQPHAVWEAAGALHCL